MVTDPKWAPSSFPASSPEMRRCPEYVACEGTARIRRLVATAIRLWYKARMQLYVGTSGFSYDAWRGSFYPEDVAASDMLAFYGRHLDAVEINNTFYRMPKPALLEGWAAKVPPAFSFALKAPRRITHIKRLREAGDEVAYLYRVADALGARRGPVLFQLPPFLRKDVELLHEFLATLPAGHQAAVEFRHRSWLDDGVLDVLRAAGAALCVADAGEETDAPLAATAPFGYLRLRREDYDEPALARWAERVHGEPWQNVWVFFKHEDEGIGPALAARFRSLFVDGRSLRVPAWRAGREDAAAAAPRRKRAQRLPR
jgi:uncharacterized protein YecE (DUF72 family)